MLPVCPEIKSPRQSARQLKSLMSGRVRIGSNTDTRYQVPVVYSDQQICVKCATRRLGKYLKVHCRNVLVRVH